MFDYILIFIFWIFTYLINLSVFPFGGDSSEIASSMSTWGLSHPPGYPLQNLLGNIFLRIVPYFNIYLKASFFSAIFMLFTSFLITFVLSLFVDQKRFKIFSGILFLTIYPVWIYGIVPEVFALAVFVIVCQIYLLLKFERTRQLKYLYLFILFLGLGISHHHVFTFFIPGYLYIIFTRIKLKLSSTIIFKSLICILLGTSFYLYAPIVSFLNTPMDMENAKTIDGFIRLIFRSSYGTFTAYSGAAPNIGNQIINMFSILIFVIKDFKPLGLIYVFLGFIYLFKKFRFLFNFFVINIFSFLYFYFITNFNLAGSFSMGTLERFLIFLYLILTFVIFFGVYFVNKILINLTGKLTKKILIKKLVNAILYFLVFFLILSNLAANGPIIESIKKEKIFNEFSSNILDSLPKNSYLFLNSDHSIFLVGAAQLIDHKRPDVIRIPSLIARDYVLKKFMSDNSKLVIPPTNNLYELAEKNFYKNIFFYSDRPISKGAWAPNGLTWRYFPSIKEFEPEQSKIIKKNILYWTQNYSLLPLSNSQKSVFFLDSIYEIYANQMSYAVDFLLLNQKRSEVKNILNKQYYSLKNYYSYQASYLKFYLEEKECSKRLEEIFSSFSKKEIKKESDRQYLKTYQQLCKELKVNPTKTNLQNTAIK